MDLIHALVFREVEAEWQSMLASRTRAAKSEVADLYWHVRNLEERMKGFAHEENREFAERVREYKQEIFERTERQPALAVPVIIVREQKSDCILSTWMRDATGLHEIPADPEHVDLPMPWLVFEIMDDRRVQVNWMFAPLVGLGTVRVVAGEGEAPHLVEAGTLWIS